MSGIWGNNIKLSIFGESHGVAIGITIDGLPSGLELDLDSINIEMARRRPGKSELSTPRNEKDVFEILSGYFNGKTTGTPLCAIIRNSDTRSKDYTEIKDKIRPGHADFTANIKYEGHEDYRGGGHFSGRITAPLVFAGAIAKQILEDKGIFIGSHIKSIGNIEDDFFNPLDIKVEDLKSLKEKSFPVLDEEKGKLMKEKILVAKEDEDSVGGVVECSIINMPSGIGSPFFNSIESVLSGLLFSVPAVKGVEFGSGFEISKMKGSEANDEYYIDEDNNIKTYSNNNGGILGGISNSMPIIFRTAFKPTASIGKTQRSVDIEKNKNIELEIKGRHDPCIVPRAFVVVEAVAAIAVLDLISC